jgi:hypothetical protein
MVTRNLWLAADDGELVRADMIVRLRVADSSGNILSQYSERSDDRQLRVEGQTFHDGQWLVLGEHSTYKAALAALQALLDHLDDDDLARVIFADSRSPYWTVNRRRSRTGCARLSLLTTRSTRRALPLAAPARRSRRRRCAHPIEG